MTKQFRESIMNRRKIRSKYSKWPSKEEKKHAIVWTSTYRNLISLTIYFIFI